MKDKTIVLWGKGNIGKDTYKKYESECDNG